MEQTDRSVVDYFFLFKLPKEVDTVEIRDIRNVFTVNVIKNSVNKKYVVIDRLGHDYRMMSTRKFSTWNVCQNKTCVRQPRLRENMDKINLEDFIFNVMYVFFEFSDSVAIDENGGFVGGFSFETIELLRRKFHFSPRYKLI